MPTFSARERANLPDRAFAYIDSAGRRRLPINDESHVRNALARFERVKFEDDEARERARRRLLRAAKRYGIVPVGFIDGQLRFERRARAPDFSTFPTGAVTFLMTDIEGSTALLRRLEDRYASVFTRRAIGDPQRGAWLRWAAGRGSGRRVPVGVRASDACARGGGGLQRTMATREGPTRSRYGCAPACTPGA